MIPAAAAILLSTVLLFCAPVLFSGAGFGNFGDVYQYAAPFRSFAAQTLQAGRIPLWNPGLFGGAPFLASPQSSLFYPFTSLFCFLPLQTAFTIFVPLHLFLNALGMFLFLRAIRRSRAAALLGGLAWAFSFFFLSKIAAGHVIHLSGYAWTPYVLLFAARALEERRALSANLGFACLVTASALQFFSGHVQVWLYVCIFLGLLFLWDWGSRRERDRAFALRFGAAFAAAFTGLALVQLLPTLTLVAQSTRANPGAGFPSSFAYAFATSYSMPWKALITWILPGFFGNPLKGNFIDPVHPSDYFETFPLYLGWVPLALAAAGMALLLRRRKFFLPGSASAFLLLSMGKNFFLYRWAWKLLNFQRVPARFYFLTLIGLILAASFAWDRLLGGRRAALKAAVLLLVLADLFAQGRIFLWPEKYESKIGRTAAADWLQTRLVDGQLSADRVDPVGGSPYRIFTLADVPNANKPMLFQIKNANGYEAVLQRSLLDYFVLTQPRSGISTTGVDAADPDKNSFRLFGVRYLVSLHPLALRWPEKYNDHGLRIYENPDPMFPLRAASSLRTFVRLEDLTARLDASGFDPGREILAVDPAGAGQESLLESRAVLLSMMRLDPNRIATFWKSLQPADFWVFLAEAYYPGWEVWTESGCRQQPFQADGYFQAFRFRLRRVPHERAYWVFRPLDFRTGAWASAASATLLAAWGFLALIRRKEGAVA